MTEPSVAERPAVDAPAVERPAPRRPRATSFRQLAGNSTLYVLGNGLRRSLSLITMPIFTRYLSTSGYGVLAIVGTIQSMLEVVYEMGTAQSGTRFYYDCRDREEQRRLFGTLFIFSIASGLALSLLLLAAGPWVWEQVSPEVPFAPYVALTIGSVLFGLVGILPRVLFRVENRVPTFFVLALVQSVATVGLSVALVVLLDWGALGPVLATFAMSVVFAGVYAWFLRGRVALAFSWSLVRQTLAFGLPEVPMRWGNWALKVADRLILQHLTSLSVVAVYSVGYSVGKIAFDLVGKGIHWAVVPFVYEVARSHSETDSKRIFARLATYNATVLAVLGLVTILFGREAIQVLAAAAYGDAERVLPFVVAASFMQESFYIPSKGLYLMKKTAYLPLILLLPAALNIGLNFLLIPTMGMMGAAWATLIAYAVMLALALVVSQRVYFIPYEWGRLARVLAVVGALALLKDLVPDDPLALRLAFKAGLLALFPVLLCAVGFFDAAERAWMVRRIRRTVRAHARG